MAYRLPGERVPVVVDKGPFAGLSVEVERIGAYAVYLAAVSSRIAFEKADSGSTAEFGALRSLYAVFVDEAQPTWDIVDHRGPVPATANGMLRLPVSLATAVIEAWTETFNAVEAAPLTAVDKLIPAGPLRDRLNAELAAA